MEKFFKLLGELYQNSSQEQTKKTHKTHKKSDNIKRNRKNRIKDYKGQKISKRNQSNKNSCKKDPKTTSAKLQDQQKLKKENLEGEAKITNFLKISDAFITSLNQFKEDELSENKIFQKISLIQKIIEEKIFCYKNEELYNEFLERVNCPFCLEVLTNKMNLIVHLDTDCKPYKKELFEEVKTIPFSSIQILPNNVFKCNICPQSNFRTIKQLFAHTVCEKHVFEYNEAKKTKNISENLFCSCCKVLISNNYSEISFHINDSEHECNTISRKKIDFFFENKILYSCLENKKYKCFACPGHFVFNTFEEVIKHGNNKNHCTYAKKKMLESFYCELCKTTLKSFGEAFVHFDSKFHKEKKIKETFNEGNKYCIFCGHKSENLFQLSHHMKSKCTDINCLRSTVNKKNEKVNLMNPKKVGNLMEIDEKKENKIYVKGLIDVQKGYLFFKKFGEISNIQKLNEEILMLQFMEKKAFEDVMIMQNLIEIDGYHLKISDTLDVIPQEKSEIIMEDQTAQEEYLFNESETESDTEETSSDEDEENYHLVLFDDTSLEALFQKVSSNFLKIEKIETGLENEIKLDCIQTFNCKKCIYIGFQGAGIHFSDNPLIIFCDFDDDSSDLTPDFMYLDLKQRNLENYVVPILNSNLWEIKQLTSISNLPIIKCIHKKSQKECAITLSHCFKLLTNMLRDCIKSNELVKRFIIIIKFWFKLHKLSIGDLEFVLMSLLLFFLLNKKIVTFPIKKHDIHYRISQMSFKEEPEIMAQVSTSKPMKTLTMVELFKLFLSFLHTFNFRDHAICLPIEHPVPKVILTSKRIKMFLNEETAKCLENSSFCILVPMCSENLAVEVCEEDLINLLKVVTATVAYYAEKS